MSGALVRNAKLDENPILTSSTAISKLSLE